MLDDEPIVRQETALYEIGRCLLASPAFWLGGAACVGLWTLAYLALRAVFE